MIRKPAVMLDQWDLGRVVILKHGNAEVFGKLESFEHRATSVDVHLSSGRVITMALDEDLLVDGPE
ncbi:MAG TPA: hypothetical protein VGH11_13525 [Jatrophihabitans sp.]|jgi:hypothetical protein